MESVSVQVDCPTCAIGVTLLLTWDQNPIQEAVTGYKVFFGNTDIAANMQMIEDIPVPTEPPEPGSDDFDPTDPSITYDAWARLGLYWGDDACFRLKAYNSVGDSDFSQSACATLTEQ